MFAYIKGSLEEKSNGFVVIETGGIGYKIFMSNTSIGRLGELREVIKVYTYYYVREDNISLYGFNTKEELTMFELLLSVSGIGAKSAITMLSNIEPSTFALAVINDDIKKITAIPGIGTKTAQRLVLELKDKLKAEKDIVKEENIVISNTESCDEAIQALQILGYNKKEIEKAFEKIANTDVSVEELIKKGLSILSK